MLGWASAWPQGEVKVMGLNPGEGVGEQAGIQEEEEDQHETTQKRIRAVNLPASLLGELQRWWCSPWLPVGSCWALQQPVHC